MAKTTNVFVRVEPQVKERAELVLNQLGIPMSNAIAIFLQQVILQNGIPFELKLPKTKPIAYGSLSDDEFNALMEKSMKDYADGKGISAAEIRKQMNEEYKL